MPQVGKKKFPYTAKGKAAAAKAAKKRGMDVDLDDLGKAVYNYMGAKKYSMRNDKSAEMRRRVGRASEIMEKKAQPKPRTKGKRGK